VRNGFVYDFAVRLGPVGVWQGGYGPPAEVDRAFAREVEALGYSAMWFGEAPGGKEAFTRAATLLAATDSLAVGTGIASIWGRDPLNTASAVRTVSEAFPGRFVAGLGVSHRPIVEARGQRYERPLAHLRGYLAAMAETVHQSPSPAIAPTILLAALGPRMLELARDAADGAHPYFVTVEHVRRARAILGPQRLLAPELAVVLEPDATVARRLARLHTGTFYLEAPNYVRALRWLGWGPEHLADGGSDELVDAIVAWGDEAAIADRVREYLDAGADHVCVQPVTSIRPLADGPDVEALAVLRRLAPTLTTP
jgi:probable F420-dependent oxidoreductase